MTVRVRMSMSVIMSMSENKLDFSGSWDVYFGIAVLACSASKTSLITTAQLSSPSDLRFH
jgi:hypothetical protein